MSVRRRNERGIRARAKDLDRARVQVSGARQEESRSEDQEECGDASSRQEGALLPPRGRSLFVRGNDLMDALMGDTQALRDLPLAPPLLMSDHVEHEEGGEGLALAGQHLLEIGAE